MAQSDKSEQKSPAQRRPTRRCNNLDGKRWLQNSISVWSDLRKSPDELRLKHPAMFPASLATRLIETFLPDGPHCILDPFAGTGSTLVAAEQLGKRGIGLELSPEFVAVARTRLLLPPMPKPAKPAPRQKTTRPQEPDRGQAPLPFGDSERIVLHQASATDLAQLVAVESVDLCVTSPPYWNILNQKRTADAKAIRHYGNLDQDLGTIADYEEFLMALAEIFRQVFHALRPGAHCCIVVMDLRKKNKFFPFHSDLAAKLQAVGFEFDDLIIWNRQAEYNNLRPLGYPAVFRVNKVHEFILLMRKPIKA
ncbi:MAG: site-specific DNA-methyltransferase [Planctomycetes bacterium]|nr:site-specific DNA-methyltransferase [Planctomycetota bacterium]